MLRGRHILEEQKATCSVPSVPSVDNFYTSSTAARKSAGPHLVPSPQQSPDGIFRNKWLRGMALFGRSRWGSGFPASGHTSPSAPYQELTKQCTSVKQGEWCRSQLDTNPAEHTEMSWERHPLSIFSVYLGKVVESTAV